MASLQKQLHEMDSEELLVLWRERRGVASDDELAEIQHHMEDAETEMGGMAVDGMPFPGELTGGGKDAELAKKTKAKSAVEICIANGGSQTHDPRVLTDAEKNAGHTKSGLSQDSKGERFRKLTDAEISKGKILVHRVWTESETNEAKRRVAEMVSEIDVYKLDIYMF